MLKLASAIFLFGFFKSNLSIKLYSNLYDSLALLFLLFIKKVSSFYKYRRLSCIDLIKLLYTVLLNTFDLYNKYNICLISFFNFIELFPACILASNIGKRLSICLSINIFEPTPLALLATLPDPLDHPLLS